MSNIIKVMSILNCFFLENLHGKINLQSFTKNVCQKVENQNFCLKFSDKVYFYMLKYYRINFSGNSRK